MYGSLRVRTGWLGLVLALMVTACGEDATGVDPEFDSAVTAEAMAEMMAASEEMAPALAGMQAASALFSETSMGTLLADGGVLSPESARRLMDGTGTAASYIPPEHHGVTFVWSDPEGYVASDETGAPANGVRIIYYAVDPVTGAPALPLNALGHVDLSDESTEAMDRLAIEVVSDAIGTVASYAVESSFTFTQSSMEIHTASAGFLSNGEARLNFDFGLDMAFTETSMTLTQDYSMGLDGTAMGVSFLLDFEGDPETETGTLAMLVTINDGSSEVVFDVTSEDGESMDGEVRYQGVVVAIIGGTPDNPTFTSPSGQPLAPEDLAGLEAVMSSLDGLFELADQITLFGG